MKKKRKPRKHFHPVFFPFYLTSACLCLSAVLIALVMSIDRVDEIFNSFGYRGDWHQDSVNPNQWTPFAGSFMAYVREIPFGLYVGFGYFPNAALVAVIFMPLLIFLVPVYDGFINYDFSMLAMAWVPFVSGVLLFIFTAILHETYIGDNPDRPDIQPNA